MTTDIPIILRASPDHFVEISGIEKFGDGSGYGARLSVSSGRFSCLGHPFYFDQLDSFTKSISAAYDKVEGKARLGDIFEKDFIEISVSRDGQVTVTGYIVEYAPPREELRFTFACDQTFLPDFLRALRQVGKDLEREKQDA